MKICFHNGQQICAAEQEFDVGLEGHTWVVAPLDFDPLIRYKLDNGIVVEMPIVEYDPKRLRVHRVLPTNFDPLISDFSILGFRKIAPHYDRGRKIKAEYKCVEKDELIVMKAFDDVRDESNGRLTGLQVKFDWYCEDNTIGATKTEIVKKFNKAQAETEERKRRERAIDFLISEARYTANAPYVQQLMTHYAEQVQAFKVSAEAQAFHNAMENETDATIQAILAARVPFASDDTYTVPIKESIQYQIGTLAESALLATLELAE